MESTTPAPRRYLFVYGSLKRGEENHRFLVGQRFVGAARTARNYRMYELDGYPGMIRDGGPAESVTGELWEVTDACLAELDPFEGVHIGLYRREPIVLAPPYADLAVETYLYARSVAGRKLLGDTWKRLA
jgi:gamma-glutamylcyclotransferase (GGCT)/AIG2-like uncharacterized protein YtfP